MVGKKMYETTLIEAETLGEAWEKACKTILTKGHKRYVKAPEYRIETLDLPLMIKVKSPFKEPRISRLAEDTEEALRDYTQYTIFGYEPEKEKEFEYTYHSRLRCYPDCKVRAWLPAVSKDEKEHNEFYEKSKIAYQNIFKRAGIGHLTYLTFASGGSFSKFSHEF
ncbi:MAG: hypothetical protein AAB801_02450, partial [Patescibacteria group bacterium]